MSKKTDSGTETAASDRLEAARDKFSEVVDTKIRGIKTGADKASTTVKEKAEKASTRVKEKAEQVTAGAKEKYVEARHSARQGYEKVSKDLEHLGEDVNEYVRHNPGKAIAIALGAGFVLGILMRGRRD